MINIIMIRRRSYTEDDVYDPLTDDFDEEEFE